MALNHGKGAVRSAYNTSRGRPAMSPIGTRLTPLPRYTIATAVRSIFDVATGLDNLQGHDADALRRLYAFTAGTARCKVGPQLSQKYGMDQENSQLVVSVTNKATLEQAWFNEARTRKPQTFSADGAALADPTDGGRKCDFCNWRTLTAEDAWGRLERPHAVTGSNLFKYGEPAHGLVLFKHHDPLAFSTDQLADFLAVSADWFAAAAAAHPEAAHPFFIWNCGPRAGASQFHGHGQLMLTTVPVPAQARLTQQAALHSQSHPGADYHRDLVSAHAAVGLARAVGHGADRCWLVAHLAPQKDMEVLVLGSGLRSPAFVAALHAALRALVDGLGVQTFNCGILNVPLGEKSGQEEVQRQQATNSTAAGSSNSDQNGRLDAGEPGRGRTEASASKGCCAAGAGLREGSDTAGRREDSSSGNAADSGCDGDGGGMEGGAPLGSDLGWPGGDGAWRPMMARVVSRGKVTSPASDFGCLEVVGHASIGHTDPFVLIRAIDQQLEAAGATAVVARNRSM